MDIFDQPLFCDDVIDALSVRQGQVGNCAFVSALVTVALIRPDIIKATLRKTTAEVQVIMFSGGEWVQQKLNPQLPISGILNQPLCAHSTRAESWVSCLEQASLTLFNNGSYEDASSCTVIDMYHLTGFIPETIKCNAPDAHTSIRRIVQTPGAVLVCLGTLQVKAPQMMESGERVCSVTGLIENHSYSALEISESNITIRNPWLIDGVDSCSVVSWDFVLEHFSHIYCVWDRRLFDSMAVITGDQILNGWTMTPADMIEVIFVLHRRCSEYRIINQSCVGFVLRRKGIAAPSTTRSSLKNSEVISMRCVLNAGESYELKIDHVGVEKLGGTLEIFKVRNG